MFFCHEHLPNLFWEPRLIDTQHKCDLLRHTHPNVLWSQLQIFGHWLYEKEIQLPQGCVSLVAQRLRSLCALERGNSQADQLQQLTFNNLNSYRQQFLPHRAVPPSLDLLHTLSKREQSLFCQWAGTGLRKDSFASIRVELASTVLPEKRFIACQIPSIKSIPEPGVPFHAFIPRELFGASVFPTSTTELDIIARKLATTSHGIRRALAIWVRRRALERGVPPMIKGKKNPAYEELAQRVNSSFGWTQKSTMWTDIYALDSVNFLNTHFMVHEHIEGYFFPST
eukprot:g12153.t1